MINFAEYEFSFVTNDKTVCIKRFPTFVTMYTFKPDGMLVSTVRFTHEDWSDFVTAFSGRYIKGWMKQPDLPSWEDEGLEQASPFES